MIGTAVLEALQKYVPMECIFLSEPMKQHTTFRVGGDAECFIKVTERAQLGSLIHYLNLLEIPYFVMGNGSNLLVSDEGYEGIIIQMNEGFQEIRREGLSLCVNAGAYLSKVAKKACECGLTGLEFAAGIPGTVGGGVVMNAGAYDGEMKQVIESVTVIDREGNELVLDNESMEFGYRTSAIKNHPFLVKECRFLLKEGNKENIIAKMEDFQSRRREKQPLEYPSAGSTFKRPANNFAGKLITDAGLKGVSIGGAKVSEKHAGFIINTGNATATDIMNLIHYVQEQVDSHFNIRLEPEVIFLGKF